MRHTSGIEYFCWYCSVADRFLWLFYSDMDSLNSYRKQSVTDRLLFTYMHLTRYGMVIPCLVKPHNYETQIKLNFRNSEGRWTEWVSGPGTENLPCETRYGECQLPRPSSGKIWINDFVHIYYNIITWICLIYSDYTIYNIHIYSALPAIPIRILILSRTSA